MAGQPPPPRFREGMSDRQFFEAVVALNADFERLRVEKDQLSIAVATIRAEKDQAVANLTSLTRSHARLMCT